MKSFVLSAVLLVMILVFFMGVFEPKTNAWYRSFPDWLFTGVIIVIFAGFLLSFYWGITGVFRGGRLFNLLGIFISLFGLAIYAFGYVLDRGKGRENPGQFDHDISKIENNQLMALNRLMQQTNTKPGDINMVAYWEINKHPGDFVICVQHRNVIALQIKDKAVTNVGDIALLTHLNWLVLNNCGLSSIQNLNLFRLERLEISHNNLTSLAGIEKSAQLTWLDFRNNPITDSMALRQLPNQKLYIVNDH